MESASSGDREGCAIALITETNRKWWTLAAVTFSLFMIMLDVTIVNVALPAIQSDFKIKLSQLEWTVNAYTLTYAVLLLTGGKLADIRGRRLIFLIGLALFVGSSFACGFAPSADFLIGARAVQGVGAAFMLPATLSIISASFAPHERGSAIGIWAAVSGIGLAIGPLVGGLFVEWLSWRWIFYINVPIGVIGFVAALIIIRESRDPSENRRLDIPGLVTSGVALFALTYGLVEGNNYGWTSQRILIALGAFVVFMAAFIVLESVQKAPMLELGMFRNPTFSGANTVGLLVFLAMVGLLFYVSIYLQIVLRYSPIQAGATFLPLTLMLVVASPIGGKITDRFSARWPMAVGMALLTVMLFLLSRQGADARFTNLLAPLLVGGFGFGLVMPPMTAAVLSTVATRKSGVASGVLNSFRQTGGAFGVAIMGAIVTHHLGGRTPRSLDFSSAFVGGFQDSLKLAAICTFAGALIAALFVRGEGHKAVAAVVVDPSATRVADTSERSVVARPSPTGAWPGAGENGHAAEQLSCLAAASALHGDLGKAVRLWGAAEGVREATGAELSPVERALFDAYEKRVRAALGNERFEAEWAEGRDLERTLVAAFGPLTTGSDSPPSTEEEAGPDEEFDHVEIGFRGTTSYEFFAWDLGAGEERGASSTFRWNLSAPPDDTHSSRRMHGALVDMLVAAGWEVEGSGTGWYSTRLRRPRPLTEDRRQLEPNASSSADGPGLVTGTTAVSPLPFELSSAIQGERASDAPVRSEPQRD